MATDIAVALEVGDNDVAFRQTAELSAPLWVSASGEKPQPQAVVPVAGGPLADIDQVDAVLEVEVGEFLMESVVRTKQRDEMSRGGIGEVLAQLPDQGRFGQQRFLLGQPSSYGADNRVQPFLPDRIDTGDLLRVRLVGEVCSAPRAFAFAVVELLVVAWIDVDVDIEVSKFRGHVADGTGEAEGQCLVVVWAAPWSSRKAWTGVFSRRSEQKRTAGRPIGQKQRLGWAPA